MSLLLWFLQPEPLRTLTEQLINLSTTEYFDGSARLTRMKINSDLTFEMTGLTADYQTPEGAVPIEVENIRSIDPLHFFAQNKKVRFLFSGAKPASSIETGINGEASIDLQKNGYFELDANIEDLSLEHFIWLNPDNLKGASGKMRGFARFETDANENLRFELEVKLEEGGTIQARFFDTLTPYLPELKEQRKVRQLIKADRLVNYREAKLTMALKDATTMKIFFHILIPDYNLNLNLNVEVLVDAENAFLQVAELLGLIRIEIPST